MQMASLKYTYFLLTLCSVLPAVHLAVHDSLPAVLIYANDPYEFGYRLGNAFCNETKEFFAQYAYFHHTLMPWYETDVGKSTYDTLMETQEKILPGVFLEMEGLADGLGVPKWWVGIMMLRPEIETFLRNNSQNSLNSVNRNRDEACSTVLSRDPKVGFFLAHNEDYTDLMRRYTFYVEAVLDYSGSSSKHFTAFVYPGQLPGVAFGFNSEGLVFSMNAIFPSTVNLNAPSRYFSCRSFYDSNSIRSIEDFATTYGCASGYSLNVASVDSSSPICNFEVGNNGLSKKCLEPNTHESTVHFNSFLRLGAPQYYDASSEHRLATANAIIRQNGPLSDAMSILKVLGDHSDPSYPIYRDATPPDSDVTIATALFDLRNHVLFIYTENPLTSRPKVYINLPSVENTEIWSGWVGFGVGIGAGVLVSAFLFVLWSRRRVLAEDSTASLVNPTTSNYQSISDSLKTTK